MINLEPSWLVLGQLVSEAIAESNVPSYQKGELIRMIEQMASIAHYARSHQLREQYSQGEIADLPAWVNEDGGPSNGG